jgi:hypothetical protein
MEKPATIKSICITMSEIYSPPGQEPIWPASINSSQLREAYPNTDFTPLMTAEEKAEFNLFQVLPTDPPTPDPAENRLEGPVPVFVDGQWVEEWQLVLLSEEEKRAYQRAMNPSKWVDFATALMANPSINQLLGNVFQVAPGLFGGLSVGLGKAAEDPRSFLFAWTVCRQKGLVSPVVMAIVVQTAQVCNLPEEFISSLSESDLARVAASLSS